MPQLSHKLYHTNQPHLTWAAVMLSSSQTRAHLGVLGTSSRSKRAQIVVLTWQKVEVSPRRSCNPAGHLFNDKTTRSRPLSADIIGERLRPEPTKIVDKRQERAVIGVDPVTNLFDKQCRSDISVHFVVCLQQYSKLSLPEWTSKS